MAAKNAPLTAPILVLAHGNPLRGDDAVGPLLGARLRSYLEAHGGPRVEIVVSEALSVEQALDLGARSLILFVGAEVGGVADVTLTRIRPRRDGGIAPHGLSPHVLLALHEIAMDTTAPPSFALAIRGERFELGREMSPTGRARLELAFDSMTALVASPTAEEWTRRCGALTLPRT